MSDFRRTPLHEMTRELVATARGDLPAALVVCGGTLVSVTSGEILPRMSVAVRGSRDRKSTRLNSSHANISYAVFCLKKKKNSKITYPPHYKREQIDITAYSELL